MKQITLAAALLLLSVGAFAQRYITSSVSEYQKLYSNKYSFIKTTLNIDVAWELSPTTIYRNSLNGPEYWEVEKIQTVGKVKRYILNAHGLDDVWLTIEGGFVMLYENGGQTKRAFKIVKKEENRVLSQ